MTFCVSLVKRQTLAMSNARFVTFSGRDGGCYSHNLETFRRVRDRDHSVPFSRKQELGAVQHYVRDVDLSCLFIRSLESHNLALLRKVRDVDLS